MTRAGLRDRLVFINVPFDLEYEPLYIALCVGLIGFGFTPRCVLEIPSRGRANRLDRILRCIRECRCSIHDLSRAGIDPRARCARFNMPFELGLAVGSQVVDRDHQWILLEARPFRLQKSLSDLNGFDPHIHGGTQQGVLRALSNAFPRTRRRPNVEDLRRALRQVVELARRLKRRSRSRSLFDATSFRELVQATRLLIEREHRPVWAGKR